MKYSRSRGRRRRGRRNAAGIVIRSMAFLAILTGIVAGLRWLQEPRLPVVGDNAVSNSAVRFPSTFAGPQVQARNRRPVYPYSVVPGGVGSAEELREVADHDPVVSEHYAGFDYRLARVIEVNQPRLVYLSYRRGGKIFWTRKQASLHVGEKLLTDGHITARTRCGNQVSVLPQANISPQEPTIAELDRPDAMASGMYQAGPSDFDSRLFNLDPGLPLGPASSLPGNLFAGGPPPGAFMPLPIGGVSLNPPTGHACPPNTTQTSQGCSSQSPPPPPPPPPPAVPEPTTILLVATGAATVLAHRWRKGA